ncbi:MAG: hypothetical protein LBJ38_03570 [Oscillospiraceae bacterium]|jgi:hypothetical protein|nr:hypothetical protein [Oscillospiraceae bacterium]
MRKWRLKILAVAFVVAATVVVRSPVYAAPIPSHLEVAFSGKGTVDCEELDDGYVFQLLPSVGFLPGFVAFNGVAYYPEDEGKVTLPKTAEEFPISVVFLPASDTPAPPDIVIKGLGSVTWNWMANHLRIEASPSDAYRADSVIAAEQEYKFTDTNTVEIPLEQTTGTILVSFKPNTEFAIATRQNSDLLQYVGDQTTRTALVSCTASILSRVPPEGRDAILGVLLPENAENLKSALVEAIIACGDTCQRFGVPSLVVTAAAPSLAAACADFIHAYKKALSIVREAIASGSNLQNYVALQGLRILDNVFDHCRDALVNWLQTRAEEPTET